MSFDIIVIAPQPLREHLMEVIQNEVLLNTGYTLLNFLKISKTNAVEVLQIVDYSRSHVLSQKLTACQYKPQVSPVTVKINTKVPEQEFVLGIVMPP